MLPSFFDSMVALIVKTSTDLPPDVRAAMKHALDEEDEGSRARQALASKSPIRHPDSATRRPIEVRWVDGTRNGWNVGAI